MATVIEIPPLERRGTLMGDQRLKGEESDRFVLDGRDSLQDTGWL